MRRALCESSVRLRSARPAVPDVADARRTGREQTAVEQRAASARLPRALALEAHAATVPRGRLRSPTELLVL